MQKKISKNIGKKPSGNIQSSSSNKTDSSEDNSNKGIQKSSNPSSISSNQTKPSVSSDSQNKGSNEGENKSSPQNALNNANFLFDSISKVNPLSDEVIGKLLLGAMIEETMHKDFQYFNIFIYDPSGSQDINTWIKPCANIGLRYSRDKDNTIKFFQNYDSLEEFIVITPGRMGEELISQIHNNPHIKAFIVFCQNLEAHKPWAKKYEKILAVVNSRLAVYAILLNENKLYLNSNYMYRINSLNIKNFAIDLKKIQKTDSNKYAFTSLERENKAVLTYINRNGNKYNLFCLKTIAFFKKFLSTNEFNDDFLKNTIVLMALFYDIDAKDKLLGLIEILAKSAEMKEFILLITQLSLYFAKNKFLSGELSYAEICGMLISQKASKTEIKSLYGGVLKLLESLIEKIYKKGENILGLKELKVIHIFLILCITYLIGVFETKKFDWKTHYQVVNFLRDIDFCLKYFLKLIYKGFMDGNTFLKDIEVALSSVDDRIRIFDAYVSMGEGVDMRKSGTDLKESITLDDSLKIKDFIVLGDKTFKDRIDKMKKELKTHIVGFFPPDDIRGGLKAISFFEKSPLAKTQYRTTNFFVIIDDKTASQYITDINLVACEFGLTFCIIIFIQDPSCIIAKNPLKYQINLPIVLVYSESELIHFLNDRSLTFKGIKDINEVKQSDKLIANFMNMDFPSIKGSIKSAPVIDSENGWELKKNFDSKLFKKIVIKVSGGGSHLRTGIQANAYDAYKDHGAKDLFLNTYCNYFGMNLYPEIKSLDIVFVKKILYAYTKEEPAFRSYYNIINEDLRSGDASKICKHLELIAEINKLVSNGELKNFQGEVYRAAYLDDNLRKEMKIGEKMINVGFWSSSKNIKVAVQFLKTGKKNSIIILKALKNNVDIDSEGLSAFEEKEVLFLPFTEFEITDIKVSKGINFYLMKEIPGENPCNFSNMQKVDIAGLKYYDYVHEEDDN